MAGIELTYKKCCEDLERLNPDDITGEALFSLEDSKVCYLNFLTGQNEKSTLIDASKEILSEKFSFSKPSLIHFITQFTGEETTSTGLVRRNYSIGFREVDDESIRTNITATINEKFGIQPSESIQPVMARFLEKYSVASGNAERRMKQIISESQPLLPLIKDAHFYEDGSNKSEIIAFKKTEDRASKQLQELLTRKIGVNESIIKSSQNDTEIVIVNEYAAFPLRLIQGIDKMRQHYDREIGRAHV